MSRNKVLVVGGCGFMGFHIVKALVEDQIWSVHVLSRGPSRSRVNGAHYHPGSIISPKQLRQAMADIGPTIMLGLASLVEWIFWVFTLGL